MPANKLHREWFMSTAYGVCACGSNKRSRRQAGKDPIVYSWGNYVSGKWYTVSLVCECCFKSVCVPRLVAHADPCGCSFQLTPRLGYSLAPWITLVGCPLERKVA